MFWDTKIAHHVFIIIIIVLLLTYIHPTSTNTGTRDNKFTSIVFLVLFPNVYK
jgi:hypothetical protein